MIVGLALCQQGDSESCIVNSVPAKPSMMERGPCIILQAPWACKACRLERGASWLAALLHLLLVSNLLVPGLSQQDASQAALQCVRRPGAAWLFAGASPQRHDQAHLLTHALQLPLPALAHVLEQVCCARLACAELRCKGRHKGKKQARRLSGMWAGWQQGGCKFCLLATSTHGASLELQCE